MVVRAVAEIMRRMEDGSKYDLLFFLDPTSLLMAVGRRMGTVSHGGGEADKDGASIEGGKGTLN